MEPKSLTADPLWIANNEIEHWKRVAAYLVQCEVLTAYENPTKSKENG
jgi:hypothetical protein